MGGRGGGVGRLEWCAAALYSRTETVINTLNMRTRTAGAVYTLNAGPLKRRKPPVAPF